MTSLALVGAILMLPEGPRQLTLRIHGDTIVSVGGAPQPGDQIIDLTGFIVFPGLINAYDRLDHSNFAPFKMRTDYDNLREWRADLYEQLNAGGLREAQRASLADRIFAGSLANLLEGVTTVNHEGQLARLPVGRRQLPVSTLECVAWAPSAGAATDLYASFESSDQNCPWIVDVAASRDASGRDELQELIRAGCLAQNTVLLHALALGPDDIETVWEAGSSIIWNPSADLFILGETRVHSRLIGRTALGTGPPLSGATGMLNELVLALNMTQLSPNQIINMVTKQAAHTLGIENSAGSIKNGVRADLVVIQNRQGDPYEQLIRTNRNDLALVVGCGRIRTASVHFRAAFEALRQNATQVFVDDQPRLIASGIWKRYGRGKVALTGLFEG